MIKEFQGEYRWLSNFTQVAIELDGRIYRSVEHAYMSAKSDDEGWKDFCENTFSAGEVKKASNKVKLVDNWDEIKLSVMRECLEQKFTHPFLKAKLLATGDSHIQEGNHWGDKFWGVCLKTGKGKNHLGRMIMEIRDKLRGVE